MCNNINGLKSKKNTVSRECHNVDGNNGTFLWGAMRGKQISNVISPYRYLGILYEIVL